MPVITAVNPREIHDSVKEAVVDSLLNNLTARLAGHGIRGKILYNSKPRNILVTEFLLPKPERERIEDEEASPIHISAHGLDFQIGSDNQNIKISVKPTISVYVRILPTPDEVKPGAICRPHFSITSDRRRSIKQRVRDLEAAIRTMLGADYRKHPEWKKLREEAKSKAHEEHGIPLAAVIDDFTPDEGEPPPRLLGEDAEREGVDADATEGEGSEAYAGILVDGSNLPDSHTDGCLMPMKWLRLDLDMPEFELTLANILRDAENSSLEVTKLVIEKLKGWANSDDPEFGGKLWGYRKFRKIRPSDLIDWAKLLEAQRALPSTDIVLPNMELQWDVAAISDPMDKLKISVHVALENCSTEPSPSQFKDSEESIFHTKISVRFPKVAHRPLMLDRVKPSYRYNQWLKYPGLGFNGGVIESQDGDICQLQTTWTPRYVQPRIIPNDIDSVVTNIADLAKPECIDSLLPLVDAYKAWLKSVETYKVDSGLDPVKDRDQIARESEKLKQDLASWSLELNSINVGIQILKESRSAWTSPGPQANPKGIPFEAWSSMNEAMAAIAKNKGYTDWRPFQLAFILANIPAFATRIPAFHGRYDEATASYANSVTLLYFATGGGKSEAFLGLLLFTLFSDRLRGKERGVSALMRYPLRLLTLQQAQRTMKVMAEAEKVRRARKHPGEPLSLGFWVGGSNTPNWLNDEELKTSVPLISESPLATEQDLLKKRSYSSAVERWRKLPECPFCGKPTALRRMDAVGGLLGHLCSNNSCFWNKSQDVITSLPFYIVDEDIYDLAPSVLLGTVDKLAVIGQSPGTIRKFFGMFGFAPWWEPATGRLHVPYQKDWEGEPGNKYDKLFPTYDDGDNRFFDPFPALLIQDEAHLLDESLGTFSGLFETALDAALDELAPLLGNTLTRDPDTGARRRIKAIAASATVNDPERQMKTIYQRNMVVQFPYPGPDLYKSFYASPKVPDVSAFDVERLTIPEDKVELRSHQARIYQSLLTNGRKHSVIMVIALANYHALITGLYERLRSGDADLMTAARDELVKNLSEGANKVQFRRVLLEAPVEQLCTLVDLHRIALTYVTNKKGGDQLIDAERSEFEKIHREDGYAGQQLQSALITGAVDASQIQDVVRQAEARIKPGEEFPPASDRLRSIIATAAVSHGVDVEELNAMFFAGMPSDIAEYIQASSRVGRTHVGFSILVPTPQRTRDRYIVEVHDIFHRFLERMILPAAVDRWAEKALNRVIPSFFQEFFCGVKAIVQITEADEADKPKVPTYRTTKDVLQAIRSDPTSEKKRMANFLRNAFGLKPGFIPSETGSAFYSAMIVKELDDIHRTLEEPRFRGDTKLGVFFEMKDAAQRPMTSLRDVDEPGVIAPSNLDSNGRASIRAETFDQVMKFIRKGTGSNIDDSPFDPRKGEAP
jgi:superfamily II DNA/RNA helicase